MFIALDESLEGQYVTLGVICLPLEKLPEAEAGFLKLRIKEKVWGEVKLNKLTPAYLHKYKQIIADYLQRDGVTFHSWTYKKPTREEVRRYYEGKSKAVIYKHAYLLLRSTIRKCLNNDPANKTFYIVPDITGRGNQEYAVTSELLSTESNIFPKPIIEFCAPVDSKIVGALQIADVCTGAVHHLYDDEEPNENVKEIQKQLRELNNGIPLNYVLPSLPKLNDFKLHHCKFNKS